MKKPHALLLIYASLMGLCALTMVACDPPGTPKTETPMIDIDLPGAGTFTRYAIADGNGGTHFIYVCKDKPSSQPVSITTKAGKQNVTTVIIDGVE